MHGRSSTSMTVEMELFRTAPEVAQRSLCHLVYPEGGTYAVLWTIL